MKKVFAVGGGKGGQNSIALINQYCADILKSYLEMRQPIEVEGRQPLFYTDRWRRWNRMDLSRMFSIYKMKAGITKPGSVHVFGRHTVATIMLNNGSDLLTIKEVLRHRCIDSTMRYTHLSNEVKRMKYDRFLRL